MPPTLFVYNNNNPIKTPVMIDEKTIQMHRLSHLKSIEKCNLNKFKTISMEIDFHLCLYIEFD